MAFFLGQALIAGASAGIGIAQNAYENDKAFQHAKQRQLAERAARDQKRAQHNEGVELRNRQRLALHNYKKGVHQRNVSYIQDAFNRADEGALIDRDRFMTQRAFMRQGRQLELLEAMGANAAAMEGDNRAGRLFNLKRTLGRYGVAETQDKLNVVQMNEDTQRKRDALSRKAQNDIQRSYDTVAIPPMLERTLPATTPRIDGPQPPSFLSNALMIGQGLIGGYQTYKSITPS